MEEIRKCGKVMVEVRMDEDFVRLRAIPPGERVFAVMFVLCLFAVVGATMVLGMMVVEMMVCEFVVPLPTNAFGGALCFAASTLGNILILRAVVQRFRVGFRRWFALLVLAICDNREASNET